MKKLVSVIGMVGVALGTGIALIAVIKKPSSIYRKEPKEQNPMEGKKVRFVRFDDDAVNADGERGHLEAIGDTEGKRKGLYEGSVKRWIDVALSLIALILLGPLFVLAGLAIVIDDPGNPFFTQKRVGQDKRYFRLHKFRTMKMSTPHDVPTHMLKDANSHITRVGAVLRRTSIDELPQVWDILIGNMSVIGPRPALWNQDCLVALRDQYGVNECRPGLTGLAQIKGRDGLSLEEKARLDGEYCSHISFMMDLKCFFGTVKSVLRHDGVIEGGMASVKNFHGNMG